MKLSLSLFAAALLAGPLFAKNAVYDQPAEFSGSNQLQLSPSQRIKLEGGNAADAGTGAGTVSGGGAATGGGGMGGSGGDVAPTLNPNATRINNSYTPPAKKAEKKDEGKESPQMPQPPGGGQGGGDQGGGKGGDKGGGCKSCSAAVDSSGSELDKAAKQMLASNDPQLAKIGGDVQAMSNAVKGANDQLKSAAEKMTQAKDSLKQATDDLNTFANQNKSDVEKIKGVADDEKAKGTKTQPCPPENPGQVSGDPKRSAKFPAGARGQIDKAKSALKAAKTAIESAEKTSGQVASQGSSINTAIAATQAKLDAAKPVPGLSLVVERAKADMAKAVKIHKERLGELEKALEAADKAEKSAKEADDASKKAEEAAKKAKETINSKDQPLITLKQKHDAGDAAAKIQACTDAAAPAGEVKAEAPKPTPLAEEAKTKAGKASSEAQSAKSAVGAVGTI